MDSCSKPHHPLCHEVNVKRILEEYFSPKISHSVLQEITLNMMRCFHEAFKSGLVSGKNLIDITFSPNFNHLLPICKYLEEISVLKFNDSSIEEFKLWKNKDPKAFDWSHITQLSKELNGICSDEIQDEEENLRCKIKRILKWDLSEETPANVLLLPKADIATNIACLEMISKDHDDYRKKLRKLSDLIKLGGYILWFSTINASYFRVGEDKFHFLTCDESFHRKVLTEQGFEITHCKKFDNVMCTEYSDNEAAIFIIARKVREP